ncbi:MAG: hypothetical protein L3J49_08475 [Desulfobulbaceae bacterium]|nr:hypothetical protein [Desulfobulbaceae bacterium]
MKQQNATEQLVRKELDRGHTKQEILARLSKKGDRDDLVFYLNNLPEEQQRRQYLWVNRLLCLLLTVLTVGKLYVMARLQLAAMGSGQFSPLLLINLIVPMINFYVLSKIIRFQRQGYQFMIVLGVLAFVRPENRAQPDLTLYLCITALSILLLLRLFPKKDKIPG